MLGCALAAVAGAASDGEVGWVVGAAHGEGCAVVDGEVNVRTALNTRSVDALADVGSDLAVVGLGVRLSFGLGVAFAVVGLLAWSAS